MNNTSYLAIDSGKLMPQLLVDTQSSLLSFGLWFAATTAVVLSSLLCMLLMRLARSRGCQLYTDFIRESEVQTFVECPFESPHLMSLCALHKPFLTS